VARRMAAEQGVAGVDRCAELRGTVPEFRGLPQCAESAVELVPRWRKCLFLYHYWMHPRWVSCTLGFKLGFHFPSRSLETGGSGWGSRCRPQAWSLCGRAIVFPGVQDWSRAQQLLDQQLRVNWPSLLEEVAQQLNRYRKFCSVPIRPLLLDDLPERMGQ